jgi:hypothetical protein
MRIERLQTERRSVGSQVPQQLPADIARFTGQDRYLKVLDDLLPMETTVALATPLRSVGTPTERIPVDGQHVVSRNYRSATRFTEAVAVLPGQPS